MVSGWRSRVSAANHAVTPKVPLTGRTGDHTIMCRGSRNLSDQPERGGIMDRLAVTAEEAAELLRIGRSAVYDLMRSHALPSVNIGRSRRIPLASLKEYIERLTKTSEYA